MTEPHTLIVDRLRRERNDVTSAAMDRMRDAQQKDADARGTLLAGSRVLDRVTGRDGVILARSFSTSTPFGMYPVQLEGGDVVNRYGRDLFARPTPPSV